MIEILTARIASSCSLLAGQPACLGSFSSGWLLDGGSAHLGRIADLVVLDGGSLLSSDGTDGVIYRVTYVGA